MPPMLTLTLHIILSDLLTTELENESDDDVSGAEDMASRIPSESANAEIESSGDASSSEDKHEEGADIPAGPHGQAGSRISS
jgi:hypothetical protein